MPKEIQTKKNEVVTHTAEPKEMYEKYLAENVTRNWTEDFVDEDTGEVVSIERKEVLFSIGTYLDNDIMPQLLFYLKSGDVKNEICITNQRRKGRFVNTSTTVWSVITAVGDKRVKLLLYANSLKMAYEIAKDFVELNYSGMCQMLQIKEFGRYIMLEDTLKKDNRDTEKKFYKIEIKAVSEDVASCYKFIVLSPDVDASTVVINNYLSKEENSIIDFSTVVESAVVIPCTHIIDKQFSQVYLEEFE